MMCARILTLVTALVACATARRIPGGRDVLDDCVIEVENGAVYHADA